MTNKIKVGITQIKSVSKKTWVFTRNFIHKDLEFKFRVIKALNYSN